MRSLAVAAVIFLLAMTLGFAFGVFATSRSWRVNMSETCQGYHACLKNHMRGNMTKEVKAYVREKCAGIRP